MPLLPTFSLPLPQNGPPEGFEWPGGDSSPTTTHWKTAVNQRDTFLGKRTCVICGLGLSQYLEYASIIPKVDDVTWEDLREMGWVPAEANERADLEPRNRMLMCQNHRTFFEGYQFFIRFDPQTQKFVYVNYTDDPIYRPFHGKAVGLEMGRRDAPAPALFLIHEMRVRGHNPFSPVVTDMPSDIQWQDWLLLVDVVDRATDTLRRDRDPTRDMNDLVLAARSRSLKTVAGGMPK